MCSPLKTAAAIPLNDSPAYLLPHHGHPQTTLFSVMQSPPPPCSIQAGLQQPLASAFSPLSREFCTQPRYPVPQRHPLAAPTLRNTSPQQQPQAHRARCLFPPLYELRLCSALPATHQSSPGDRTALAD